MDLHLNYVITSQTHRNYYYLVPLIKGFTNKVRSMDGHLIFQRLK